MTKKRPNALEMLAQVMAQMAEQQAPVPKLPPAPVDQRVIGGK